MSATEWYAVRIALLPFLNRSNFRPAAFGVLLAILLSYNAFLTVSFGLIGSLGNSIVTGGLLFALPTLLLFLSFRKDFRVQPADFIFAGFVGTALISFFVNTRGDDNSTREHLLLVATLAGYIACRSMVFDDAPIVRSAFARITAVIVLAGAVFTAAEIFRQWDDVPGKPFVFGFNAAGTYFMASLSFLIIALVTIDKPRPRRTILVSALVFLPAVIFAAAMVRFTFLALAGSMFVALILTERGKRWHVMAVGLTICLAIAVGLSARHNTAKLYASYILEESVATSIAKKPAEALPGATEVPSCGIAINARNSIAIRQALAKDAISFLPAAGPFGIGLDGFLKFSCIKAHQVHISVLQAAVEFGWLGGAFFVALIGMAIFGLVPLARRNGASRFILCSLVFAALLSLAHGRISRDSALFALLGCAVGIACRAPGGQPEADPVHSIREQATSA